MATTTPAAALVDLAPDHDGDVDALRSGRPAAAAGLGRRAVRGRGGAVRDATLCGVVAPTTWWGTARRSCGWLNVCSESSPRR